jgi:TRAP-type C4-dicarboxylate transport system substrate-binding protein
MQRTLVPALVAGIHALMAWQTAAAQGPVELRYATSAPPKTVWAMQAERFQGQVVENSKGKLKVNVFLASQLGSEQDTVQQVARGRIDMGGYSITAVSLLVPEMALLNIPFLFESQKQQDCVIDQHLTKLSADMLARKGVTMLGWSEVGVAGFIGKKPILVPEDVRGLKARSQPNKVAAFKWTKYGANPSPLPVTEWVSAHQTGLVDVADSAPTFYFFSGLAKVAPVFTKSAHQDQAAIIIINKGVFDKLPKESQEALVKTSTQSPATQLRSEVRGFEGNILDMHVKAGGQVVEMSETQRAVWRKGLTEVWPDMIKAVGGDADSFWKTIQDGVKACAAK